MMGFRDGKSLKDFLVRAKLQKTEKKSASGRWLGTRCEEY